MFSYLLIVAELLLIHLGRTRNARWFFGLPIVFLIWINSHASFILGIAVACAYLVASFFEFETGRAGLTPLECATSPYFSCGRSCFLLPLCS